LILAPKREDQPQSKDPSNVHIIVAVAGYSPDAATAVDFG
jgi:hypothetical protein